MTPVGHPDKNRVLVSRQTFSSFDHVRNHYIHINRNAKMIMLLHRDAANDQVRNAVVPQLRHRLAGSFKHSGCPGRFAEMTRLAIHSAAESHKNTVDSTLSSLCDASRARLIPERACFRSIPKGLDNSGAHTILHPATPA